MKQVKKSRLVIVIFLALTAALIVSCSGLQLSQLMEGMLSSNESNQETPLKSGTLSLDEISIDFGDVDIPEGSDLILTDVSDTVQADGLVSSLYRLDMDFTCSEPITISINLDSLPTHGEDGETLMIGIGLETTNGGSVLNQFIKPIITDKTVTAEIVPSEILDNTFMRGISPLSSVTKTVKEHLYIGTYWNSSVNDANNHFKVWFPGSVQVREHFFFSKSDREALLADLEVVYQNYLAKGYAYKKRTKWPIDIYIQSLDAEGYYSEGKAGTVGGEVYADTTNYGCIYLNSNLFKNGYQRQRIKEILAHEFFHFVQYNYANPTTGNPWLDEATATYYEYKERGAIPDTTIKYWSLIYDGVFPEENTSENGYARMPLIDYLAKKYGEDFILNAYQFGGTNGEWENALHVALQGPPDAWVNDFYQQYFTEKIVSFYKPFIIYQELISGKKKEFTHAGQALALAVPDKEYIFACLENDDVAKLGSTTLSIPAFGARVIALDIEKDTLDNLPDEMDPVIHVEGNVALTVYAIKGSSYEKLEGNNDVKLTDFVKANEESVNYMALVVGLHNDGKADIEFSVQLPPGLLIDSIKLAKEDTSGIFESGYSAALMELGDIPVDSEGTFTATLDYAQAQYEDISNQCGYEETRTWSIEVTNFEINGKWNPFTQTGQGTISCHIDYVSELVCAGSTGEVMIKRIMEANNNDTFNMEIKDNYLDIFITIDGKYQGTETWYPSTPGISPANLQGKSGGWVEVKFSYTMP
jgi:hypothetical protein